MRAGAQIISYELSVALSLLTIVVLTGSLQLSTIIESQRDGWWIFKGHIPAWIAFIIFLIAGTAETNRGPFDLAEAESELTAGFHTEYSGLKFAFSFWPSLPICLLSAPLVQPFSSGAGCLCTSVRGTASMQLWILYRLYSGFWKSFCPHFCDDVVPLDLPAPAH